MILQIHDLSKHPKRFLRSKEEKRATPSNRVFSVRSSPLLAPVVRLTSVRPMLRVSKLAGALTSYQSFFENGSALKRRRSMMMKFGLTRRCFSSTYTFFLPPFLPPLVKRLFLPMAMFFDDQSARRKEDFSRGNRSSNSNSLNIRLEKIETNLSDGGKKELDLLNKTWIGPY